ncbi:MucR family transcriptional regulator [Sphingomonas lycopersici]|uniref:MucR family transcriptional regulator n=1 Tax=Sphingomonas lycopersici TaxID=2951807 RepID=A0AA41ZBY3_9SPHN|nr:MucR family transcriptional regulator [Sphingomonas lycopersici]MCW6537735.1 MucR family transcriptional regulator [Sphingomonas lycopersici]
MTESVQPDVTAMTVSLLSAYVSNNNVPAADLAALIETTRKALIGKTTLAEPAAEVFVAATTVRKSLASPDHILSMIDGKPYKTLKRHISTHGLTVEEYRARYKLPHDYPLVAENYSASRREVAQRLGLGRKPAVKVETPVATAEVAAPVTANAPAVAVAADKPVVKAPRGKAKAADAPPKAAAAAVGKPVRAAKTEANEPTASKAKAPARQAKAKPAPVAPANVAEAVPASTAAPAKNGAAKPARKPREKAAIAKSATSLTADLTSVEAKAPKKRATLRPRFKGAPDKA